MDGRWRTLAEFQLQVAERWAEKGRKATDRFAEFFFSFAGLNALYFLWCEVDQLRSASNPDRRPNESKQLHNLVMKLSATDAERVIAACLDSVEYFVHREPIERMDVRGAENASHGDSTEGRRSRRMLSANSASEKLAGLAAIAYLVRSNLVHGSKTDSGDDEEVIRQTGPVVAALLAAAVGLTRRAIETMR